MGAAPEIYDAAVFGNLERVKDLLKVDPKSVNARDEYGFTPLHGVAGEDQLEMAEYLIAQGADVGAVNDSGITPLHLAAYPEMVELLVENGAALDARAAGGGTPLHVASELPEGLEVMLKMLEMGAAVNAKDDSGRTALDAVMASDEQEKILLLLAYGGKQGADA